MGSQRMAYDTESTRISGTKGCNGAGELVGLAMVANRHTPAEPSRYLVKKT